MDVVEKLSERELNERIARIREKNKEREKRELMIKEEIQAAKQKGGNAVVNIKSPIILDDEDDYGPTLYSDQIDTEKRSPKITEWGDEVQNEEETNSKEAAWREERKRIDNERIRRQKADTGSWKREWDADKIVQDRNKYSSQKPEMNRNRANRFNDSGYANDRRNQHYFNATRGNFNEPTDGQGIRNSYRQNNIRSRQTSETEAPPPPDADKRNNNFRKLETGTVYQRNRSGKNFTATPTAEETWSAATFESSVDPRSKPEANVSRKSQFEGDKSRNDFPNIIVQLNNSRLRRDDRREVIVVNNDDKLEQQSQPSKRLSAFQRCEPISYRLAKSRNYDKVSQNSTTATVNDSSEVQTLTFLNSKMNYDNSLLQRDESSTSSVKQEEEKSPQLLDEVPSEDLQIEQKATFEPLSISFSNVNNKSNKTVRCVNKKSSYVKATNNSVNKSSINAEVAAKKSQKEEVVDISEAANNDEDEWEDVSGGEWEDASDEEAYELC